jgi:hypothetical protein
MERSLRWVNRSMPGGAATLDPAKLAETDVLELRWHPLLQVRSCRGLAYAPVVAGGCAACDVGITGNERGRPLT